MQLPLDGAHRHMMAEALTIFLSVTPGLEQALCEETRALGFMDAAVTEGGVTLQGGWDDLWRAALSLRGASRILLRLGEFRALHLASPVTTAPKLSSAAAMRWKVSAQW